MTSNEAQRSEEIPPEVEEQSKVPNMHNVVDCQNDSRYDSRYDPRRLQAEVLLKECANERPAPLSGLSCDST